MHPAMQTLRNALAYAKFSDGDLRDATLEVVDQIGVELQEEDYELGPQAEGAVAELETCLNNIDSSSEATDEAIRTAASEAGEEDEEEDSTKA